MALRRRAARKSNAKEISHFGAAGWRWLAQTTTLPARGCGVCWIHTPGALRSLRELSLAGSVDPDIWRPPTSVGSRGRNLTAHAAPHFFSLSQFRHGRACCSVRGHGRHLFGDITDSFVVGQVDRCDLMACEEDAVVAVDCEGPEGNALTAKGLRHLPVASLETDVVLGGGNAADDLVCVVFGLRQAIRHLPRAWAVAVGGARPGSAPRAGVRDYRPCARHRRCV